MSTNLNEIQPHMLEALARWESDQDVIARRQIDRFETTISICRDKDGRHNLYRAFTIGFGEHSTTEVSCDVQHAEDSEAVIRHLLDGFAI